MKKLFRLAIGMLLIVIASLVIKAGLEDFAKQNYAYAIAYIIGSIPLIYIAYHLIDPIVSSVDSYEQKDVTNNEPMQMSLLQDEPVQVNQIKDESDYNKKLEQNLESNQNIEPDYKVEPVNDNKNIFNQNNNKKDSKAGIIIVAIILIFIYMSRQGQTPAPVEEKKNYVSSSDAQEKDGMLLSALEVISEYTIRDVEMVEINLDLRSFYVLAINHGAVDTAGNKYKYYYMCKGEYTDKSTNKINKFIIGIAFKDDSCVENWEPYTVLRYANPNGGSFNYEKEDA